MLLDGIELCREIARADAFAPYRGEELLPGAEVETREEMRPLVRGNTNAPTIAIAEKAADLIAADA